MNKITVFESIHKFMIYRDSLKADLKIGFVPTMGALHGGHAELIKRSSQENDLTVLSIFVNPTQFSNSDDLKKYPRTWESDIKVAETSGADIVLAPNFEEAYPDNYKFKLSENEFSLILCGAHRPGHFDGVLTVVMKLLQIVNPNRAYFGEKDFQQLKLIQDMTAALFLRTQIVACATRREEDGLAMSSRNVRLSPEGRKKAPLLYKALLEYSDFAEAKNFLNSHGIEVEYFEQHFSRRFIAAMIDGVRLIDNVKI
ncbi:MAG: pantoate--beta-alanine ligase [Bdellovibrionota bacterium]|mgnify:CR=1 FL=1